MARRILTGAENVRRVFRNMAEESVERITHALNKGGEEVAERARQLAPVDPTTQIDLKDQIEVYVGTRANARGNFVQTEPNSAVVYVVAGDTKERRNVAFRMEYGRAPGGSGSNAGHPGHPAQEFMFPAYFSVRNRVRSRIKRAVKAAAVAAARG